MAKSNDNPVVQALIDAGAPQSQIDNAIAQAKAAPEQEGAGVPYVYPDVEHPDSEK